MELYVDGLRLWLLVVALMIEECRRPKVEGCVAFKLLRSSYTMLLPPYRPPSASCVRGASAMKRAKTGYSGQSSAFSSCMIANTKSMNLTRHDAKKPCWTNRINKITSHRKD